MFRLILTILMIMALPVFTDEFVGIIVDNFNSKNFKAIYSHFDSNLKKAISQETFQIQMTSVRDRLGIMQDYLTIDVGKLYFICETQLDTGTVNYKQNEEGELTTFYLHYQPKSTFTYLHENRKNPNISLSFTNPRHAFYMNEHKNLSICSVYKITLVAEYARQVTAKVVNPIKCIDLSEINIYYMPHVDNGHTEWLKTIKKTCATHQQIVVGMIQWSSNAIAEYLTDLLTPKKVDQLISKFNLTHSKTMYVVSSMFAMNNTYNLPRNQYLNLLRLMTQQQVRNMSQTIHQKLKNKTIDLNKDLFYLDPEVIDIHVELLERSDTISYLKFMKIINQNLQFDSETLDIIKTLFDEVLMTSNFAQGSFVHIGAKGGSASFPGMKNNALAVAGYAEMGSDVKISYALVMNGLSFETFQERRLDLNEFILALQTSEFYVMEFINRMLSVSEESAIKEKKYQSHKNLQEMEK